MKKQTKIWLLLIGGVSMMILVMYLSFSKAVDVDACLDQGGRFDYATETCDLGRGRAP